MNMQRKKDRKRQKGRHEYAKKERQKTTARQT